MDALILIGSCCLICLLPLSLYFLFLSYLHSRRHPVLMDGRWDFASLLLGISGFLLILGPLLLTVVDSTWRAIWVSGQIHRLRGVLEREAMLWSGVGTVYLLCLLGLIVTLLRARSLNSVVYGIPPARFADLLSSVLERVGRFWSAQGDCFTVRHRRSEGLVGTNTEEYTLVEIDPFPAMGVVTLHWDETESPIRTEIEHELKKSFERMETAPSPISGWLQTASVAIFLVMMVWMAFLIVMMWTGDRRA